MNENTPTPVEDEVITNGVADEENLSAGNGRLALIVGGIVALVVSGYALLPAQATRKIVNAMPGIELGDATVTGSRATEAPTDTVAAATATPAEAAKTPAEQKAAAAATKSQVSREAVSLPETETAKEVAHEEIEVEPVPAAAAEPAAPTMVTISGRILNENGRPLAGATVLVKGSKKAVGTDANGNYSLELPAGDNTLVYGYGGYEDQEVHTHNAQPVNVTLVPAENTGKRRRR